METVRGKSFRPAVLLVLMLAGCAGAPSAGTRPVHDLTLISPAQLARAEEDGVRDLYELIQISHPGWLRVHTPRTSSMRYMVVVYQNGHPLGSTEMLRHYPLTFVTSVR